VLLLNIKGKRKVLKEKNKKGQGNLTLYILGSFFGIILITIAAVIAPLGVRITSEFFVIGADMIDDANTTISAISDTETKEQIQGIFNEATNAQSNNIEVLSAFYQYGWLVFIIILGISIFLLARATTEKSQGFN